MKNIALALIIASMGSSAFAEMTCQSAALSAHHVSGLCSAMTIPDNSAITAKTDCNGYSITIDCDLHSVPNKLTLTISGPTGQTKSTSSETEVHLTDINGNGAVIECAL